MTPFVRYVLPIALMLAAAPATAFAQSLVCHAIRRGESATQVARRVTGDGRNAYQAWFQIMNLSSRFVPKSQYSRIRAGWQACVIKPAIQAAFVKANRIEGPESPGTSESGPNTAESSVTSVAPDALAAPSALAIAETVKVAGESPQPLPAKVLRTIGSVDLTMVWLGAAMVVPWLGWRILDDYLARRKTTSIVVRHFAHRFIDEFERPLVRYHVTEHPVRSRLRCGARRARFDILLTPAEGRRYPNLSDHKKNVEYDVSRVMHVLADDAFVSGPLYTHAGWVVVPFQFKAGPTRLRAFGPSAGPEQPGVTCISSF